MSVVRLRRHSTPLRGSFGSGVAAHSDPDPSACRAIRDRYFRDPDGHPLEILWFPEGKGDPRWHRPTSRLFLGIDHTAIVVADTARSLQCYRDALGRRVVGESENYGPSRSG
jgi:catechol 2,3-dioxygenase-like lactoylglutathione lyase family enzyme